jgi:4-amino-4-deoxychorismate lyase
MSQFIESIRIESGRPLQVDYHMARIRTTILHFFRTVPDWDLSILDDKDFVPSDGIYKCRALYNLRSVEVGFEAYTIQDIRSLKLVDGRDIYYAYKYADRSAINKLYEQRQGKDDILIVCDGRITDTSYGNVALLNNEGEWVTPETCLLQGTMRRFLIETGRIIERKVMVEDLALYKQFRIINALRGWDTSPSEVSNID